MNTHLIKSTLEILFCLVISFSSLVQAAEYGGGSGTTAEDPYQIWTPEQMNTIGLNSGDWGKHFKLMADIDMSAYTGTDYNLIGNSTTKFAGTFDGNGHVISNLTITASSQDHVGLFGYIDYGGKILNLGVQNVTITAHNFVGGLAGFNRGSVMACYATGFVSGNSSIGGLIGSGGTVTACYAISTVNGSGYVGGLVGQSSTVTASYAKGTVSGSGDPVGALMGGSSGTAMSCFWEIQTSGQTGSAGGKGLTTEQMKTLTIFQNADWANKGWVMNDGVDYPRLAWEDTSGVLIPSAIIPFDGSGETEDPYLISTAGEFALLSWYTTVLNKHIQLTINLDLSNVLLYPIGDLGPFTGVFDGSGHTISNAMINQPENDYVGLFSYIGSAGQIQDLGVVNVNISGGSYVGGLLGYNHYGAIEDCFATGTISGSGSQIGGLVGHTRSTITGCYATCTVSGSGDIGGLAGYNDSGTITDCYAGGTISGESSVGGLVGENYSSLGSSGSILNCYATGSVSGTHSGGLVGTNAYGVVEASYATGSVSGTYSAGGLVGRNYGTITDCYSTGTVSGDYVVGGLVGFDNYYISFAINGCFWDMQTSGLAGSSGGKGLTTEQMKTLTIFQNAGWADKGWVMNDGMDYPRLDWENTGGVPIPLAVIPFAGSGTSENPYMISTAEEFALLSWYTGILGKHIHLANNVDLNGITLYPIGDLGPFTGVFDGSGYIISNAVINQPGNDYVGLFSYIGSAGYIKNIGVQNVSIVGSSFVGGLVGKNEGTISACYAAQSVSGSEDIAGGLVGYNYEGTIMDCYAASSVSSNRYVGGLVGWNYSGRVIYCYSVGKPIGMYNIGGLCGYVTTGGDYEDTGNFWDMNTSETTISAMGIGRTTAEMQDINTFLIASWDFVGETANGINDIWTMPAGGYPALSWQTTIGISGTTAISLSESGRGQITFEIYNLSEEEFNWTLTGYESCTWITNILPISGSSANSTEITGVTVDIDAMGAAVGEYICPLTVLADNGNSQVISITLSVYDAVDIEEFALLASYWGMNECETGQPCADADWFVDGTIDILDLTQLAKSWLGEEIEIGSSSIQENFETGDFTSLNWQQGGNLPWKIVSHTVYEGSYAVRSGAITHSQTSSMSFTADATGLGVISFAYKVSSESNYDYLRFYIDSVEQNKWSGTVDWSVAVFPVSDGPHSFEWRFTKDGSVSSGSDCAWMDDIRIENPQTDGPISDHVFEIEMSLSYDFGEGYTSSVPVDYHFDAWMQVDNTVVSGTVTSPSGTIYPAEMEVDDGENWLGVYAASTSLEDLSDFTDGEYIFTVTFANGTSQSTSILFALEDGSPIPPVDQPLVVTYPLHDAINVPLTINVDMTPLTNPDWTYGIWCEPVYDDSALSGEIDDLPYDTTTAGPLELSPDTLYEIEITVNHAIWSTNEDGIPYVIDKDSEVEIVFTTGSE